MSNDDGRAPSDSGSIHRTHMDRGLSSESAHFLLSDVVPQKASRSMTMRTLRSGCKPHATGAACMRAVVIVETA